MLLSKSSQSYAPPGTFDTEDRYGNVKKGSWRHDHNYCKFADLPKNKDRSSNTAQENRNILCDFVNGNGAVPWQWKTLVSNSISKNEE